MPRRTTAAFSPDGRWLATSTTEYQLWEVGTWQPKGPPVPGLEVAEWNFTAFSPDGRVMARTMEGYNIQLLETSTEKPLTTLEAQVSSGVSTFQFSPDGSHLAAQQRDRQVQLWDLRLIRQELAELHLDWDMPPIRRSRKGRQQVPSPWKCGQAAPAILGASPQMSPNSLQLLECLELLMAGAL
jgi:WD40 repeat protein